MKICDEALKEAKQVATTSDSKTHEVLKKPSRIKNITWNGAYFVNSIFGTTTSAVSTLFTPHHVAHEWIVLETTTDSTLGPNSFYCVQFAGSDSQKAEITMSHHTNLESANEAGMRVAGRQSYHEVQKERLTKGHNLVYDFINFLKKCDDNYNLLTNNCQTLTSNLYAKFAYITLNDQMRDHERAKNTLGFSREPNGTTTIVCSIV